MCLKLRPALEAVFASDDKLGIAQGEFGGKDFLFRDFCEFRMRSLDSRYRFGSPGLAGLQEVLCLMLEMIQIRTGRQLFRRHDELLSYLCLSSACSGRK